MVSSSATPEEAGPTRRREKRRMSGGGAAGSLGPGDTAAASQDQCSLRRCEKDIDGATTTCGKWHPGESQRPEVDDAPIFTPTEEEFKDAIGYIASIRPLAEKYGICRIIPPSSWRPPCPLKEKSFWESTEFNTRVQQVDKLQNRDPAKKRKQPRVQRKRKRRKRLRFGMTHRRPKSSMESQDKFGFQSGSDFTLEKFQKYADEFKQEYFGMKGIDEISLSEIKNHKKMWEPSVEEIEGEYWRVVIGSTDEVEVDYGADLDTALFGSGFAKLLSEGNKKDAYVVSCWNLNNLPRLPGSVISFENEDVSGVVVPWLYVGMCFSSFCWHVEDHFLYSLNYMHFGEPKVWYGVPGGEAVKLEESMRKNLPKLFDEQPDLLQELVTQLSPSVLKSEGVSVYRAVQGPGEFVLTLPRAYHSGFNSGFNCAEAVNVAPVDWLPHGQCAVELYREQHRKTSISHDKLLLKTAKEAVKQLWMNLFNCKSGEGKYRWLNTCGEDGVLTSAVKTRVKMEGASRDVMGNLKNKKMDKDYDSTDRECFSCFYDLHLSAVSCQCSPNRFACLNHTNILCPCEMDRKIAFFRYSMEELNTLVAALEGDRIAVCLWGQEHLGLVCPSGNVHKRKVDSGINTEFAGSAIDVNAGSWGQEHLGLVCPSGNVHKRKVDSGINTEFAGSAIDVNAGSWFGGSEAGLHDLQKPAGFQQENRIKNNYVDLNIENPLTSYRIKEESDKGRMFIVHGPLQNTDSPFRVTSECSSSSSLNYSSNLFSPSRNQARNPNLAWNTSEKLFGVDIGNLAKHSDSQFSQMVKISSGSDVASKPSSRCHVEPLDYGTVMIGKKWFDNQAIFPKGFKSRVTFYNVQDPTRRCFYVSEVIDAGPLGPLFKVTLEQVPSVSFTHTSPTCCWDSVRDKVNEEIINLQKAEKCGLPDLLLPDSVNGLEMFGFLSPEIMQVVESLDPNNECLDYWLSKASCPVREVPSDSMKYVMVKRTSNSNVKLHGFEIMEEPEQSKVLHLSDKVTLNRLSKKAKLS